MPDEGSEPIFVDASTAARMLSISRWTLYQLASRGDIASYALPHSRALRFKVDDVRQVLKRREPTAAAS